MHSKLDIYVFFMHNIASLSSIHTEYFNTMKQLTIIVNNQYYIWWHIPENTTGIACIVNYIYTRNINV